MEKEVLESYHKAIEISDEVIKFAKTTIKEGESVLIIAEKIENKTKELGGKIAFPLNIGINEVAAHFTPDANDTSILKENDIVKIDIGVHIDGYIADRAFTICIGKKSHPLIDAADKALNEALKLIKAGTKVYEISEVVENTLTELGFNPIRNLSGHRVDRFIEHAHPSIPNGKNTIQDELESDQVIAMEVFATTGSGLVKDSRPILIYEYSEDKPVRLWEARKILDMAKNQFERLPFAKRWIKGISPVKLDLALMQLLEAEALNGHPILKEISNGLVAQSEETVIVK